MNKHICNYDCLNCKFEDCINDSDVLSDNEVSFSTYYESLIKSERVEESIRQTNNPHYRSVKKYRHTEKGKEMLHRMNTNEKAKERYKRYEKTDKAKERRKRHELKPERVAYRKDYMKGYNKNYYNTVEKQKREKQRVDRAKLFLEDIKKCGEAIVKGGQRNRPRERRIFNDILQVLDCDIVLRYDEERGVVYNVSSEV